jgi:hypothetical protein
MKVKTSELQGAALDWAVGYCEDTLLDSTPYAYSTDWAWGGPIIEREEIDLYQSGCWAAEMAVTHRQEGPTPLVAAMRCYVGSVMGNEVEVPDELAKGAKA